MRKALVIYDSQHGNTERVASAIGDAIDSPVRRAASVKPAELADLDLLIVGSPTHGGWFSEDVKAWLETAPDLQGVRAAAFDTRTATIWNRILPFGYAAPKLARRLEQSGAQLLAPAEGFVVLGMEGPLKDGELARAAGWAQGLVEGMPGTPEGEM